MRLTTCAPSRLLDYRCYIAMNIEIIVNYLVQ